MDKSEFFTTMGAQVLGLAEDIRKEELDLLSSTETYTRGMRTFDIAVLEYTTALEKIYAETKDKDYSTVEKRVLKAECHNGIAVQKYELDKLKNQIETAKIETAFLKRKYEGMIAILRLGMN